MTNIARKKCVQHPLQLSTLMICNFHYKVELIIYTIPISLQIYDNFHISGKSYKL